VAAWMAAPACFVHALCARRAVPVAMRVSRAGRGRVQRARLDGRPLASILYMSACSDVVGPDVDGSGAVPVIFVVSLVPMMMGVRVGKVKP
jgi:hypothetical protein